MWDLAGSKGPRVKDGKSLPLNLYIGHFLKPYFKDKVTGVVSPRHRAPWGGRMVSNVLAPSRASGESQASSWSGAGSLLRGSAQDLASRGGRGPARQGCPVRGVGPGTARGSLPLFATLLQPLSPPSARRVVPGAQGGSCSGSRRLGPGLAQGLAAGGGGGEGSGVRAGPHGEHTWP